MGLLRPIALHELGRDPVCVLFETQQLGVQLYVHAVLGKMGPQDLFVVALANDPRVALSNIMRQMSDRAQSEVI